MAARRLGHIMEALGNVQPYGQTPLTAAVQRGAEALHFRERPAVIVLLTDGDYRDKRAWPEALGVIAPENL